VEILYDYFNTRYADYTQNQITTHSVPTQQSFCAVKSLCKCLNYWIVKLTKGSKTKANLKRRKAIGFFPPTDCLTSGCLDCIPPYCTLGPLLHFTLYFSWRLATHLFLWKLSCSRFRIFPPDDSRVPCTRQSVIVFRASLLQPVDIIHVGKKADSISETSIS
jgi:hypothetical protein